MKLMSGSVVAAAVLAFGGAPLFAQDDTELARVLAQRGWFDLAEDLCDLMEQRPSRSVVPFLRAEIKLGLAERESEYEKAAKGLSESAALFRSFFEGNPTHPMAIEARTGVSWAEARKGRLAMQAVELESDPVRKTDLQKQAVQAYEASEKFIQETIERLRKEKGDRAQDALMDARLEFPRILMDHAKVGAVDDATRKKMLTQAKALLLDFEFDYGDRPIAFEAMLEGGKCMTELAEYKQAEGKLRATLALRKRLVEAKIKPNEYHHRIIYGAYVALTQSLVRAGRLHDAKSFVNQVLREDKTVDEGWAGPALRLEKAEILFRMKDVSAALGLATEVIDKDPDGRWGFLAKEKLKKWGEGGASLRFGPAQLMTAADHSMDRELYRDALRDLRRTIEACRTGAEREKFVPLAYYKMGQCFQSLRRNYEAAAAYEKVFNGFPRDPNAAKACYEAVRCFNAEFALSGDRRDDEQKEAYLSLLAANWPRDPAARNLKYVQAEKVEKTGDLKGAAELYRQVGEDAEAYESALVAQGYCYYADAARKWDRNPKDPQVQKEAKEQMRLADQALTRFLARVSDPTKTPPQPEQQKARAALVQVAHQQLAYIYMHEAVGKSREALTFLERVARDIPPDDERISKIWATQIQARLNLKQVEEAVKILDLMFEKFPDVPAIARACKSVAIRLDEQTTELMKTKSNPTRINDNLRRISRYYAKWLNLAPALNMRITLSDVVSVAEALYMIAKHLNGLDENVISFVDLKGHPIAERQYFLDAAFVHALLTEGKVGKLPDRERILLMTRLARCHGFVAEDADEWSRAKDAYDNILRTYKVLTPQGTLDPAVLQAHRELLGIYVEEGYVYYRLGKCDPKLKFQFDNASTVFSNVLRVVQPDSEPWWQAKFMVLQVLFDRGGAADVNLAKVGIENLERSNPEFDGGRFGMKARFQELKKQVNQAAGSSGR